MPDEQVASVAFSTGVFAMRKMLSLGVFLCAALIAAATLRADESSAFEESTADPAMLSSEPILGSAAQPAPSEQPAQRNPFKPYDVGDPASVIPIDQLTPEERQVVEHGRNVDGWQGVQDSYGAAVVARSKQARAESAARQLGIDNLASQGVVE